VAVRVLNHQFGAVRQWRAALLASSALVLASALPAAGPARAQDATWTFMPGSADYNTGVNWNTGTVPTGTAFFGTSGVSTLSFSTNTDVDGWTFNTLPFMWSST
jgi:hypothetical protein